MPKGAHCQVAVSVQKAGPQWQICLRPGYVVCSQLAAPAHLHYTGQLAGEGTGDTDAQDSTLLTVLPDSQVSAYMPCCTVQCTALEGASMSALLALRHETVHSWHCLQRCCRSRVMLHMHW